MSWQRFKGSKHSCIWEKDRVLVHWDGFTDRQTSCDRTQWGHGCRSHARPPAPAPRFPIALRLGRTPCAKRRSFGSVIERMPSSGDADIPPPPASSRTSPIPR